MKKTKKPVVKNIKVGDKFIKPEYEVTLDTCGVKHNSRGETIDEAIANLNLSWEHIKSKGVLTVKYGDYSHEHLFYLKQLKRIFANKMTRLMWSKRLNLLLQRNDNI